MKILKKLLGLAVVFVGVSSTSIVIADDSGTTLPWKGFYIGAHLGETMGVTNYYGTSDATNDTNSLIGGAQIGYNWQHEKVVMGLEADASKFDLGSSSDTLSYKENWMMTFRGRVGYDVGQVLSVGEIMPYLTAGLAGTDVALKNPNVHSSTLLDNGAAAGIGVDDMFANHWIARLEYLYTGVPRETRTVGAGEAVSAGANNNTLRVGINYKF